MIKAIGFDLGGVLYTYDHKRLMKEVSKELSVSETTITEAWKKGIIDYELGKISENEFWRIVLSELNISYDSTILHKIVIDHFQPMQESLLLLNKLKGKVSLGMITNQTSWIYELDKKYGFRSLFDIVIVSNEVALRKPQEEIFDLFIKESNLESSEIIFIDDNPEYRINVEKTGIKFLHFKNAKELENDLNKLKLF